jgi:2-isopropylmalate synthase
VHFYNSVSELQRRVVFGLDKAGIIDIAVNAAGCARSSSRPSSGTEIRYEYSPESFTGTEPEFAVEICEAVMDVIEPTPSDRSSSTCPATVEMYSPNVYADVIEWFGRTIKNRDAIVLSLHPHNDRGTAVAAAELAVLAGADRVEGTLFGNGERTGNVDVVTLAMNLFSRASTRARLRRHREGAPGGRVRHPPARPPAPPLRRRPGLHRLLGLAPGRHQEGHGGHRRRLREWEVPYLPIDPKHTGRTYEAIIQVNSQSGKGGVAYLMDTEHGLDLPRRLQIEFSKAVQAVTEASGTVIRPARCGTSSPRPTCPRTPGLRLITSEVTTGGGQTTVTAQLLVDGQHRTVDGPRATARSTRWSPPAGRARYCDWR